MSTSFYENLCVQLAQNPTQNRRLKRHLVRIDRMAPSRKARVLARMENHARGAAGIDPTTGAIDWSTVDWKKLLTTIVDILVKILPLILAML